MRLCTQILNQVVNYIRMLQQQEEIEYNKDSLAEVDTKVRQHKFH